MKEKSYSPRDFLGSIPKPKDQPKKSNRRLVDRIEQKRAQIKERLQKNIMNANFSVREHHRLAAADILLTMEMAQLGDGDMKDVKFLSGAHSIASDLIVKAKAAPGDANDDYRELLREDPPEGLRVVADPSAEEEITQHDKSIATRMKEMGLTDREIAKMLRVPITDVRMWLADFKEEE